MSRSKKAWDTSSETHIMTGKRSRLKSAKDTKATSAVNGYPMMLYAVNEVRAITMGPPEKMMLFIMPHNAASLMKRSSFSLKTLIFST